MKPYLVGQAPSRQGDGRPFTGASGRRLIRLLGEEDYQGLNDAFELYNLLSEMQPKERVKGDVFNLLKAEEAARRLLLRVDPGTVIIACGRKVYSAFTGERGENFHGLVVRGPYRQQATVYQFPHPSGVNLFWNKPENVERASIWLQRAARDEFPAVFKRIQMPNID